MATLMNLSAISSIVQQIHTIHRWRDIKTTQHRYLVENLGNPELNITGASVGMDLVLFYIRTPHLSQVFLRSLLTWEPLRILHLYGEFDAGILLVCSELFLRPTQTSPSRVDT